MRYSILLADLERFIREMKIPFAKNHFEPSGYTSTYIASFSWDALKPRKVENMSIDEIIEVIKKLKDKILLIATESEQHYSVYNLYLRIDTVDGIVYMIKISK